MSFPSSVLHQPMLCSYLCESWELRITQRCLEDDLGRDAHDFADLLSRACREIVSAFTTKADVWVVGRGHDHRGGTWHDEENRVIWLLAYGDGNSGPLLVKTVADLTVAETVRWGTQEQDQAKSGPAVANRSAAG